MMARRLVLVVSSVLVVVPAAVQANLLTRNPGFEEGTTQAWSLGGSCLLAVDPLGHTGAFGGSVTGRSRPWDGPARQLSQEIDLAPGTPYAVSVWVRQDARASANLTLVARQSDDAGLRYTYLDVTAVSRGQWERLSGVFMFEPEGDLQRLTVYVGTVAGEGNDEIDLRVDDACVVIPGDADEDGDVDLGDLALLLSVFGECGSAAGYPSGCDVDEDGCVGLADLALLLQYFGAGGG